MAHCPRNRQTPSHAFAPTVAPIGAHQPVPTSQDESGKFSLKREYRSKAWWRPSGGD